MFWRRNYNIQSVQLSEMGLAYVDFNTSDAGEIFSGSYPLLNKNNIIWSNFVISADGSRVNLRPTLQISYFSKCYLVLHKLLGNRTSLSCMIRRTGTSLQNDLVSGLYCRSNTT